MTRPERVAQLRRAAGKGWYDTTLLGAGAHHPRNGAAIANWHLRAPTTRPVCFACQATFSPSTTPGAFLTVRACRAPHAGTAVAACCGTCWSDLEPAAIEGAALALLRRQLCRDGRWLGTAS